MSQVSNQSMTPIDTLFIAGVGLIGGSLGLQLKQLGLVRRVIGYGRRLENLQVAQDLGVIDEISTDLGAISEAEIVMLAVPVVTIGELAHKISPYLKESTIITDVGSTKVDVINQMRVSLGQNFPQFVPGHPIAGGEKSGAIAAKSDLFVNHKVLLTPEQETNSSSVDRIAQMWSCVGANVSFMDPKHHDTVLALTSHLPHVLAFTLVNYLANDKNAEQCFELAAGGFLDFTRIASSDPEMWRDICISNRNGLLEAIDNFSSELSVIRNLIANKEHGQVETIFHNARNSRDELIDRRRK